MRDLLLRLILQEWIVGTLLLGFLALAVIGVIAGAIGGATYSFIKK